MAGNDKWNTTNLAADVKNGSSLAKTSPDQILAGISSNIACVLEISNYTKWQLSIPEMYMPQGVIHIAPTAIDPGKKEAFSFHNRKGLMYGCGGVCVWKINNGERNVQMVALAPYIPYQHTWSENSLSVAVLREGIYNYLKGEELFKYINNQKCKPGATVSFSRESYGKTNKCIRYESEDILIEANFASSFKSSAIVKIYPTDKENLHKKRET